MTTRTTHNYAFDRREAELSRLRAFVQAMKLQRRARLANAAAWLAFVGAFAAGRWTSSMVPSIIAAFAFFAFGLISIHCPVRAKTILDPRH